MKPEDAQDLARLLGCMAAPLLEQLRQVERERSTGELLPVLKHHHGHVGRRSTMTRVLEVKTEGLTGT